MNKLLLFLTICLAISLAIAHRDKDRIHGKKIDETIHFGRKGFYPEKKFIEFCSNKSIAENYLTRILALISELQANTTYQPILSSQWANFIKYIQDKTIQELLHSDCTKFIQDLKVAKQADKESIMEQMKLAKTIVKQMKEVAFNLNNGKEFQEIDI